jgi:hypothetical protein
MRHPPRTHADLQDHGTQRAEPICSIEGKPVLPPGSTAISAPSLFDPVGAGYGITEAPIKWRLHWRMNPRFVTEWSQKPQYKDHQTRGEAEFQKRAIRAQFDDEVVVCIEPIFLRGRTLEKWRRSAHASPHSGSMISD